MLNNQEVESSWMHHHHGCISTIHGHQPERPHIIERPHPYLVPQPAKKPVAGPVGAHAGEGQTPRGQHLRGSGCVMSELEYGPDARHAKGQSSPSSLGPYTKYNTRVCHPSR